MTGRAARAGSSSASSSAVRSAQPSVTPRLRRGDAGVERDIVRQVERPAHLAQVEVEPGAIARGAAQRADLLRQPLDHPGDRRGTSVEILRETGEIRDVLLDARPDLDEQLRGDRLELVDAVDRVADRLAVVRIPRDELLQ